MVLIIGSNCCPSLGEIFHTVFCTQIILKELLAKGRLHGLEMGPKYRTLSFAIMYKPAVFPVFHRWRATRLEYRVKILL
eukprot:5373626-Pleurochrysis_carterae.AAC.3